MTTSEIFQNDQVLTLKTAQSLLGKKIAATSPEYRANRPHLEEFTVSGFISEWDAAALDEYPATEKSNYKTRQEYWASYMNQKQINELKNTLLVLDENGKWRYKCHTLSHWYGEPTFTGSDEDREVYYVEVCA